MLAAELPAPLRGIGITVARALTGYQAAAICS